MPIVQRTFLKTFLTKNELWMNYEWIKNDLQMNYEWI
jgi:hypothetical protein